MLFIFFVDCCFQMLVFFQCFCCFDCLVVIVLIVVIPSMAPKLYGVNATITIFIFVCHFFLIIALVIQMFYAIFQLFSNFR